MRGVDEVFLAEARPVVAEQTGDSCLIFQEVAAIRRLGISTPQLEEVSWRAEAAKVMESCAVMGNIAPNRCTCAQHDTMFVGSAFERVCHGVLSTGE